MQAGEAISAKHGTQQQPESEESPTALIQKAQAAIEVVFGIGPQLRQISFCFSPSRRWGAPGPNLDDFRAASGKV